MMQTIKQPFLISLRNDKPAREMLADKNGVPVRTMQDWLRDNHPMLTTAMNLAILKEHFGLLETSELLERELIEAAK